MLLLNPLFKINVKAEDALHLNEETNIEELIFEPLNIKISIVNGNERLFEISSDFSKYDLIINKIKEELNV